MKTYHHLQAQDRQRIYVLHINGLAPSRIATDLGRHVSTIRRELARNALPGGYDDRQAQKLTQKRRCQSRGPYKLDVVLASFIHEKLRIQWSPEQICHRWALQTGQRIHWMTVYRYVYREAAQGGVLWKNMRCARSKPKPRKPQKTLRELKFKKPSIHERPPEVAQKQRLGDQEIDTIVGPHNQGAIVSITDRVSYRLILIQIQNRQAYHLAEMVKKHLRAEKGRILTMTSDNGKEFNAYERIAKSLNIKYFFADPYQTNQRALIEHENKLIRQYLPKGTDLRFISQRTLNNIAALLNNRPRKKLGFKTPNEIHYHHLHST